MTVREEAYGLIDRLPEDSVPVDEKGVLKLTSLYQLFWQV